MNFKESQLHNTTQERITTAEMWHVAVLFWTSPSSRSRGRNDGEFFKSGLGIVNPVILVARQKRLRPSNDSTGARCACRLFDRGAHFGLLPGEGSGAGAVERERASDRQRR